MTNEIASIHHNVNGSAKVRPARGGEWTTDKRARFLAHLAATCNVSASAKAVGIHNANVYALRRRDPDFAAAWAEAIEAGYARIEMMLIERAQGEAHRVADAGDALPLPDAASMDTGLALELLRVHGAVARGGSGRRIGGRAQVADRKAVAAKIMARIAAERRRAGRKA